MTKAPCVDSVESGPLVCFFTSVHRGRKFVLFCFGVGEEGHNIDFRHTETEESYRVRKTVPRPVDLEGDQREAAEARMWR